MGKQVGQRWTNVLGTLRSGTGPGTFCKDAAGRLDDQFYVDLVLF